MSTSKVFLNYTDFHNVDEDLRTISVQGGSWDSENETGAAFRAMANPPTVTHESVASFNIRK